MSKQHADGFPRVCLNFFAFCQEMTNVAIVVITNILSIDVSHTVPCYVETVPFVILQNPLISTVREKSFLSRTANGRCLIFFILSMEEGGNQAVIDYVQQQEKPQVKKQRRSTMDNRPMRRGSLLQSIDASIGRKRNSL